MAGVIIVDPLNGNGAVDRSAGIGLVQSIGTGALRRLAGLNVTQVPSDIQTYVIPFNVAATAALDVFTVGQGGTSRIQRLRRIVLVNPGSATAGILVDLTLGTAASAGSGGGTVLPQSVDRSLRASGVTGGPDTPTFGGGASVARTGDTTQAGGFISTFGPIATISVPAAAAAFNPLVIYDGDGLLHKPLTVTGAGGNSLIVLRVTAIGAGATGLRGYAIFTDEDA